LTDHASVVYSVAFSPDGKALASASGDKTIILWDMAGVGQSNPPIPLGPPMTGHKGEVRSVAFSPDGKKLASGSVDKTIILWDVETRQPLDAPLDGHNAAIWAVGFSPDGKMLAAHDTEGNIILWDVASRQPLAPPLSAHAKDATSVSFSPDGSVLATSTHLEGFLVLWDVSNPVSLTDTGELVAGISPGSSIIENRADVLNTTFSPDGRLLALGGISGATHLWDVASRQSLGLPLTGQTEGIRSLSFSADGKTLASASPDRSVMLWDTDLESWQARACRRANRNLTRLEWQQFFGDEPYRPTCPDLPGALEQD
jgi:WD40 repeat protein